jgi:hypothetical protein
MTLSHPDSPASRTHVRGGASVGLMSDTLGEQSRRVAFSPLGASDA